MKILHIITSLNRGGAENHLVALSTLQAKQKNNKVSIIYLRGDDYWVELLKKKNIFIKKCNTPNNYNLFNFFFLLVSIFFFIKKKKPDIVHAHLGLPEIISLILKTLFRLNFKFIITKHLDSFFFEGSRGQNHFFNGIFLERIIFKISDHIIFISKNVKSYFLSKINISSVKNTVVYYGTTKKNISFKKKEKDIIIKKKIDEKLILNIARHVPQKKIDLLIKSFAEYCKKNKKTKLILVGHGSETQNLKLLAKKLNIESKIHWIYYTDNVLNLFKISDVFCLSSKYEGLGLVLLESLLLKVPVITMNASAMKEVIKNNYSGILLPKNCSPKNFSKAISKVLNNSKFRNLLIKNGTTTMNEIFNEKKMLYLTTNIYNKI